MSEAAAPAGFGRLLSDERLTRRAVDGDERAFAAIFRRYHQSLYRFCLAIVGNPEDAQDALQNTMIKVMRALPGEERKIELKPWLYRIAHNEAIDLLRRRRETVQLDVEQVAPGYGLSEDAETRERLRRLLADLRELPERQRDVLVMREMSGLDFEEIGVALKTTPAVIRQTLYEARQSLRQMDEGREMSCDAVTRSLSDGDGRVARRRDVRAHLRSCAGCREFRDEIKRREGDFAALAPLPAIAAAGMLQGLVGGGAQAATGGGLAAALGGGAAKTIAASAAVKGVATVAVVAAVGVTAADRTGVIHLGLPGEKGAKSSPAPGSGDESHGAGGSAPAGSVGNGAERSARQGANRATSGSAPGANAAPAGKEHGQGAEHANQHSEARPAGPPTEHASGQAHEQPRPESAAGGQETAAENQSKSHESQGAANGKENEKSKEKEKGSPAEAKKPAEEPAPAAPAEPPKKEPPANPPQGAAQNPSPPVQKPQTPAEGAPPPGQVDNPGKGHSQAPA
ncbi:MAG TPA: sigma-70 family RNA polymerase sigma factor [Solirubrobacterales bacterium]|nr:sigma-70 family RNA polymerase sigma factor [Solirubrobacterales bacterium]